ncbi:uncharacterized protein LOC126900953 [Daktulosphaira vitifoliae]|uniref:uncharacterized protein LOC126900953 n=1 Tax=Daktulosphaira vitifoliae TaxID=58002 RepID=UPI0021AADC28|nr:uncharacterized protein LOC126900953 [Daktulosphaira vitifoliae]
MASKKHSGAWFEKERNKKKKQNEKLATNMAHWLTQKVNNENHEKDVACAALVEPLGQKRKSYDLKLETVETPLETTGSSDKVGDDNCGIFLGLIELISHYDPLLAEHVNNVKDSYSKNKVLSYFSPIVQNELITFMGQQEQLTEIIRYVKIVDGEVTIEESFVDFVISHDKTGAGLADEILSKLKEDGLNIQDCRGQGFDNGANMAGIYNGVQAHIISKNALAIFVPCAAHSLNLIGVHAAQTSSTIITFFGVIQKLFTYFSGSTSRWEKMKSVLKITLKPHCDTRWSTKKQAISVLKNNIKGVHEILKNLSEDSKLNNDTKQVLNQIDYVNIALQTKNQTIDVADKMLNGLIKSIQEIREEGFQKCLKLKIKPVSVEPTERENKSYESTESEFRAQCFEALDSILSSLCWRFEKMSQIACDFSFLSGNSLSTMESENIKLWVNDLALKYDRDLNATELYSEIESFKYQGPLLMTSFEKATHLDILKHIHKYSFQDLYPNLEVALRIFLTIPVTTASCERSFSKLKIIKNYLRSTMSQSRLTSMAILSIEKDIVKTISFNDTIDKFASQKARKVSF